MTMLPLDNTESKIRNALHSIDADASRLKDKVFSRLSDAKTPPSRLRFATAIAIALAAALILACTATGALGGFDWFVKTLNPSFSEVVEPVGASALDQGFKLEVIGARKYRNQAIVYMSLQDVTGQNRMTESFTFMDYFSVKMSDPPKSETGAPMSSYFSTSDKILHFDKASNTIFYELVIWVDPSSPLSDPLTLKTSRIYYSVEELESILPLEVPNDVPTVEITEDYIMGSSSRTLSAAVSEATVLKPGQLAKFSETSAEWLSSVGFIDGKLHVQTANDGKASDPMITLESPDGQILYSDFTIAFYADKDMKLISRDNFSYDNAACRYYDTAFTVPDNLQGWKIVCNYRVFSYVDGLWRVSANTADSNSQMLTLKSDYPIEGLSFDFLALSPIGLEACGTWEGEDYPSDPLTVEAETATQTIPLTGGGGSFNPNTKEFQLSWTATSSIDINSVQAILINGERIPVAE
jgi:hypothetical protein